MDKLAWFNKLSGQVANGINEQYMPEIMPLVESSAAELGDFAAAQTAVSTDPDPLTPEIYLIRTPYQTREIILGQFEGAAERGFLKKTGDEAYALTDVGRELAEKIAITADSSGKKVQALPQAEMDQLVSLLHAVVDACVEAAEPPHSNLNRSRFYDPGLDAPAIERVRRYLNDLNAFRDDAHISAWQAYDLAGYEWEAFSHIHGEFVFGDPVGNGEELAEKLNGFRGYDAPAYETALQEVTARGWLEEDDGRYKSTAEGRQLRENVEVETDRLFFAPWELNVNETVALETLMTQLHESL
ncbi:MAG: hypothetical protein GY796_07425 [Chloroflexi bacterium]|nr:hypothetical protein [Chloroflexota bacterium]